MESTSPSTPSNYVPTATSERIVRMLSHAQSHGDVVVVHGGPGTGKTTAIQRYLEAKADRRRVWLATMRPSVATVVPALEEIAEATGLKVAGGARVMHRAISERVAGLKGLIVIDEAQHLKVAALEEIRALHDVTGVGIALIGNETVYTRLTGGSQQESFAQLYSRIGVRIKVAKPRKADVRALAKARWDVENADVLAILERIADAPGALRLVTKVMNLATKGKSRPTAEDVETACALLGVEL